MSHFTEAKTNLKDALRIKKVLKQMGYEVLESPQGVQVRGYEGQCLDAEFKIHAKHNYDIGFVRNEQGNYDIVGDWELMPRVAGLEQESFAGHVSRNYAYDTIMTLAQQNGHTVETYFDEETQTTQMVVSQW